MISITDTGRESAENGREPHLELHSDSKVCMFINMLCEQEQKEINIECM